MKKNIFDKYKIDFNYLHELSLDTGKCTRKKCKKEYNELKKYKVSILKKISKLKKKERNNQSFKNNKKKRKKVLRKYQNNKDVIKYFENMRKGIRNNEKIEKGYNKALKIYKNDMRDVLKEYYKTKIGKYYYKKFDKLLSDISPNNKKEILLKKCSFKKCLEIHKKGLQAIKKLTQKLCKEKIKTSCKIFKAIDKLDINKITFTDNLKLIKMMKYGLTM